MKTKIYSKQSALNAFNAMLKGNRLPHAFLIFGEKGTGKKTLAEYFAMLMLCENGNACGECRNCINIQKNIHPDVIRPERSGKTLIYRRETIRDLCRDAYIKPNDCDKKIYILADCENMEETTQNLMLKLIEEPPDDAYFIFTATSKSSFLPTIISRVISIGVSECSEEECRDALIDTGKYTDEQIETALRCFPGNIGNCIDYLDGGDIVSSVSLAQQLINCIINGNEYDILKALNDIGDNRPKIREVLSMADKIIRDSIMIRLNNDGADVHRTGCYMTGSQELSQRLTLTRAEKLHTALADTVTRCFANVHTTAILSALTATIMQ